MIFDPNAPAAPGSGVFGLPHREADALVVLVPIPWEATTSYGGGAAQGPRAIKGASAQVDLYDLDVERPYQHGIFMRDEDPRIVAMNEEAKERAQRIIEAAGALDAAREADLVRVNALSAVVNAWVEAEAKRLYAADKIVGVVGGDHSVPFGAIHGLADVRAGAPLGVLHFDAHSDTRDAYEGFTHSHASIMRNVLERVPAVTKLVQVGIRDVCEEEMRYVAEQGKRVAMYSDRDLAMRKHAGESFLSIAKEIAAALPDDVWVSFDIDGLDPRYCPHTGTPVPGGLDVQEVVAILREVVRANKRIVGFDLNEVAPNLADEEDEWDGNVGARMLYKLVGFTLASQGKARLL